MTDLATLYVHNASRYVRDVHLDRLRAAADTLPDGDLWWRPHEGVISLGNILLHLEGNVRQWWISGLGGRSDARDRASEFEAGDGPTAAELLDVLAETVRDGTDIVDRLGEAELVAPITIQGMETTTLDAVLHVVEHFSWHTGQAVWIAKARAGVAHGLAFYDDAAINAARND